jgi:hypothetical protein
MAFIGGTPVVDAAMVRVQSRIDKIPVDGITFK